MSDGGPAVSVVIPSIKEDVVTLESIPDGVETHVVGEPYSLNEARNEGVRRADGDVIAVLDDDIEFPPEFLHDLVERVDEETLLGVADWDYGWIAGRVMVFHRVLWEDVGGFDERLESHMGDTKFALDALRHGYDLERIPHELVHHYPHSRDIRAWDHAWRGLYLALRHPRQAPRLFKGMVID